MPNPADREQSSGQSFHIADCHVWAEIHYLDSPTDYREYLPPNRNRPHALAGEDLVMLDSSKSPDPYMGRSRSDFLVPFFILLIAGLFLYVIRTGF